MMNFNEHGLRHALVNEVHARPFERLEPPVLVSHVALLTGEGSTQAGLAHMTELCTRMDVEPPQPGVNHFSQDFGGFRCKWEGHAEFASYSFFVKGGGENPFADTAIAAVPGDWLDGLPGKLLVASHLALESAEAHGRDRAALDRLFSAESLAGSRVAGGHAEVWADFRLHEDGFSRILVRDMGLRARQAGRLAQRMLEIETYRILALLSLPLVRDAGPEVADAEGSLSSITEQMPGIDGLEDERSALGELAGLAARLERLASRNTYRFSASVAYYELVEKRVAAMREERIEGMQTISEFLSRRMAPAMRTCQTMATRQDRLAERVARTTGLLRTRVDLAMEAQNRDLLRSMDRRAKLQLRLQQTVEGLSVAAISYYLVGLVGYAAKGMGAAGLPVPVELITGLSIPVVILVVWAALRRVRRRLTDNGDAAAP
jgi:uncharacterized membrane-anchored protein